ncbi:MAG: HAD family hydrolase [Acidobacteriota bacterium]|nr:HAD family hydrolase [Acidobacteriota bacterium]
MIPAFPVYLFDIDGTLLDSAEDICGAVQHVLSTTPAPPASFDYLRSFIGLHLDACFGELLPHYTREQLDDLILRYRTTYWAREHESTRPYPGVREGLERLGGRKATATTKSTATTRVVLEKFGLERYFDHVQGTDGFPCKPEPDVILAALHALKANPAECLFIGDSPADMEAGRRAGVKVCAVDYGYGKVEELAKWKPDYSISDLRQLC